MRFVLLEIDIISKVPKHNIVKIILSYPVYKYKPKTYVIFVFNLLLLYIHKITILPIFKIEILLKYNSV